VGLKVLFGCRPLRQRAAERMTSRFGAGMKRFWAVTLDLHGLILFLVLLSVFATLCNGFIVACMRAHFRA